MCGIYSCLHYSIEKKQSLDIHKQALECISHRGLDASELKTYNTFSEENEDSFNLVLGHNRLSIIDLDETANQPFEIDNKYTIVFNGEIFNYIELREELKILGVTFSTSSDTEVLLKAYVHWGISGFNKLNGMWSFVIYDKMKNLLIISRDRFSIKPLYYRETNDSITFASEIKQLRLQDDKSIANKEVVEKYLCFGIIDDSADTFFAKYMQFPPASTMEIDLNNWTRKTTKYWEYPSKMDYGQDEEYWLDQFNALFSDAVNIRLRSDVPIGNSLSGGLDSSAIAMVANKHRQSLMNFSVVSKEKKISEEEFVDLLTDQFNLKLQKISADEYLPWNDLETVIWHHDEPLLSFSAVNHYNMMRRIKKETNLTVILSGQGGDEGLAGYGKYLPLYMIHLAKQKSFGVLAREVVPSFSRLIPEFNFNLAKRYMGSSFKDKIINTDWKPDADFGVRNTMINRQIADYSRYSVPSLCHYEDRTSMAFGLEIRLPFLDHRLVELLLQAPENMKIRKGYSKYILRKSLHDLPNGIRWRKDKKGFNVPEKKYFEMAEATPYMELVERSDSFIKQTGLIDNDFKFKGLDSDKAPFKLYSRMIFLEAWAKKFNVSSFD